MNMPLKEMMRRGPYRGEDAACGFCGGVVQYHIPGCPWPSFVARILEVWPEWVADLNYTDMQERLDAEHAARAAGESDPKVPTK